MFQLLAEFHQMSQKKFIHSCNFILTDIENGVSMDLNK